MHLYTILTYACSRLLLVLVFKL